MTIKFYLYSENDIQNFSEYLSVIQKKYLMF